MSNDVVKFLKIQLGDFFIQIPLDDADVKGKWAILRELADLFIKQSSK